MAAVIAVLVLIVLASAGFIGFRFVTQGPGALGFHTVPPDSVGIVYRRFGPSTKYSQFKRVMPDDARGLQARTLLPARRYWLPPWLYRVTYDPATRIPDGAIGLVTATDGAKKSGGRAFGRAVECDDFQDGAAFLLHGGEQGRQIPVLSGGHTYYLNTRLFTVEIRPRTHVPGQTIGLVIAKDGAPLPPDRLFGQHVECANFVDGVAFLTRGGQQGRQLAILPNGTYDINVWLFEVITAENIDGGRPDGLTAHHLQVVAVPATSTGVVITLIGAELPPDAGEICPVVEGHRRFRLPWVFLERGGYRGVQEETLGPASLFALNPWFVRVVLIPSRVLSLEWTKKEPLETGNFDAPLGPITVNIQGFRIKMELSQTLRIPPAAAPGLVHQFGDATTTGLGGLVENRVPVQRFVERVLGGAVETYFNGIAAERTVEEFVTTYGGIRTELASRVRNALSAWGVEAVTTNLGEFEAQDPRLDRVRQTIFEAESRGRELTVEEQNALIQARIESIRLETARKERQLQTAALEREIELLGSDTVAMRMFLEQLKEMGVPEVVSGDADGLLQYLPMQRALELIDRARQQPDPPPKLEPGSDS